MFCLLFSIMATAVPQCCHVLGFYWGPQAHQTNWRNQTHERYSTCCLQQMTDSYSHFAPLHLQNCDKPWISGALSHASNVWPACFKLPCWPPLSYMLFTKSLTSWHLQKIHQSASTGRSGNVVLESGHYAASQDKIWLKSEWEFWMRLVECRAGS